MASKEEESSVIVDEDTVQLRKILDLESAAESELDWYATKTFEAFLDALDVNQPTNMRSKQPSKEVLKEDTSRSENLEPEKPMRPESSGIETILSAEALKILSELPDLSYMSSARSFMFPKPK